MRAARPGIQVDAHIVGSGARQRFSVWRAPDLKAALDPQFAVGAHYPRSDPYVVAQDRGALVIDLGPMRRHTPADPDAFLERDT